MNTYLLILYIVINDDLHLPGVPRRLGLFIDILRHIIGYIKHNVGSVKTTIFQFATDVVRRVASRHHSGDDQRSLFNVYPTYGTSYFLQVARTHRIIRRRQGTTERSERIVASRSAI